MSDLIFAQRFTTKPAVALKNHDPVNSLNVSKAMDISNYHSGEL